MDLLTPTTAAEYLRETGRVDRSEPLEIRELSGGVSNVALYVHRPAVAKGFLKQPTLPASDFVLKQARERLAVAAEWLCDPERIFREIDVLRSLGNILAPAASHGQLQLRVPTVLFEDRDQFLFAMTAAPPDHSDWKTLLLANDVNSEIGAACGHFLALIHAHTWNDCDVAAEFEDDGFFDELRVDPYYRHLARHDDSLGPAIDELIVSLAANRLCLVHGDFSPKNLLVDPHGVTLIDCEVGHFGDPAFDLGFFLAHLVLKAYRVAPGIESLLTTTLRFLNAYASKLNKFWAGLPSPRTISGDEAIRATHDLFARTQRHLGACLLARLAGKSPVDYLGEPSRRAAVDRLGRRLLCGPLLRQTGWLIELLESELAALSSAGRES